MEKLAPSKISGSVTANSPLYGDMPMPEKRPMEVDIRVLADKQVLYALEDALGIFEEELAKKDYSYLTINSYSSAVNRFIDFLREGEVIPDPDRKNKADDN